MANIFPIIESEDLLQDMDRTRIDISRSFASETITKLEIEPQAGVGFFDVTVDGYLDWAYDLTATPGATQVITAKVTTASGNKTVSKTVSTLTSVQDGLYSTDAQLREMEPEIMKLLPAGRATFLNVHRRAQGLVLAWFDKEGIVDAYGHKLTKASLKDASEVSEWSKYIALRLIFEGTWNAKDDVFQAKAKKYGELEDFYRDRSVLRFDVDADGQISELEQADVRSCFVARR